MGHFSILLVLLPLNICISKTVGVKNYSKSRDLHWQQDHHTQLHSEIGRQPVNKERKNCAPNPLLKNLCNDYKCFLSLKVMYLISELSLWRLKTSPKM